jgi:hypothetical protein
VVVPEGTLLDQIFKRHSREGGNHSSAVELLEAWIPAVAGMTTQEEASFRTNAKFMTFSLSAIICVICG